MVRIIFSVIIMLFFLQADGTEIICRYCNLSLPFHGCLLDGGTCRVDPGQYCKVEYHEQGGVEWFSVKGCTTPKEICHSKRIISNTIHLTQCCYQDMCNI
uniref:Uncharacterized protein C9orf57 homolog isoform X2 n=1 Tax=Phascolarctos cinereus TaxID=38626 RepID=A0A6P5LLP7_PHACI|nr:uncharacterized protein C9orf57 homolog isoform X2 [Phascolarctos cinereus]